MILAFLTRYWSQIGAALGCLFFWLWISTPPCPTCPACPEISASQGQKVLTKVQIVYKDKDSICPDIAFDSESVNAQGVSIAAKPEKGLKTAPSAILRGPLSFSVGADYHAEKANIVNGALGVGYWWSPRIADIGLQGFLTYPVAWNGPQWGEGVGGFAVLTVRP